VKRRKAAAGSEACESMADLDRVASMDALVANPTNEQMMELVTALLTQLEPAMFSKKKEAIKKFHNYLKKNKPKIIDSQVRVNFFFAILIFF
jgi:hypothetical protein